MPLFATRDQCQEYVLLYASDAEVRALQRAPSVQWNNKFDNILISYDTMSDWLFHKFRSPANFDILQRDMNFMVLQDDLELPAGSSLRNTRILNLTLSRRPLSFSDRQTPEARFRYFVNRYIFGFLTHKSEVSSALDEIAKRVTGKALLNQMNRSDNTCRIVPFWGEGNADESEDKVIGEGKGSSAKVRFSAGRIPESDEPDETLFHESVHALREMDGAIADHPAHVNRRYDDEEEYIATVITNIYLSEKGRPLQASHEAGVALSENERKGFMDNIQNVDMPPMVLLDRFKQKDPDFYDALLKLAPSPRDNFVKQHDQKRKQGNAQGGKH